MDESGLSVRRLAAEEFREFRKELGYDEVGSPGESAKEETYATRQLELEARKKREEAEARRSKALEALQKQAQKAIVGYAGAVSLLSEEKRRLARPVIVEFCGTPRSGKTSCIETVEHFFRRLNCRTKAPLEGAQLAPDYLKEDLPSFNTYTLCYAITTLLQEWLSIDKAMLVLLDRGPYDSFAWMDYLVEIGKLNPNERDALKTFVKLSKWSGYVDQVFVMTCSVDKALGREQDSKLIEKDGIALSPKTLEQLLALYKELPDEVTKSAGSQGTEAVEVDTTDEQQQRVIAYGVTKEIIRAFEARTEKLLGL